MKQKYFLFLFLSFLIFNFSFLITHATVRFVSKSGTSQPPYTSWQTAADSIQKCINICVDGDTIYVANGVYKERIDMIPGLSLIGAGMDSCIIDTRGFLLTGTQAAVLMADSSVLAGFQIIVSNTFEGIGIRNLSNNGFINFNKVVNSNVGISIRNSNALVENNSLIDNLIGMTLYNSNSLVQKNNILTKVDGEGITISAINFNFYPLINSNYIHVLGTDYNGGYGIDVSINSRPSLINNIIILNGRWAIAYSGGGSDTVKMFNNLVISYKGKEGFHNTIVPTLQYNNFLTGDFDDQWNESVAISTWNYNDLRNNVVTNTERAVSIEDPGTIFRYNNIWDNGINYTNDIPDSTNFAFDPLIVNDDSTTGEFNFHLQKYSPLIDAGDPNIFDKDSSRSDIGLFGGPFGESYKYLDLAPRAPINLTALVDSNYITLNWNRNTEADTSFYKVYRDTVTGFLADSTKLVSSLPDTFFIQINPHNVSKCVYKVTCVDNQGNESEPSDEVVVNITSVSIDEYPMIISDYILYQNYPNPFNPGTTISYRLKERGYVKLYVYDIKGELVSVLVNKTQEAGFYQVDFNTTHNQQPTTNNLASGIYIYQIHVIGENNLPVFTDIKKMMLIK